MNTPIPQNAGEAAAPPTIGGMRLSGETIGNIPPEISGTALLDADPLPNASAGARALQDPIRNPPSLPGEAPFRQAQGPELAEGLAEARKEASHSEIRNLLEACLRMLKLTGGSQYWTGDTQAALEFMEAAVAAALEMEASRTPPTRTSPVVPEIVAAVAASVQCTLQMAGINAER